MMKRKKYVVSIICLAFALVISACAKEHVHTAAGDWQVDLNSHWKVCADCDETVEPAVHTLNDESVCSVCNCEIFTFDDGTSLSRYDENGNPLMLAEYGLDGKLITKSVYEYEYDQQGNMLASKQTTDDILTEESKYTVIEGESVIEKTVYYYEDGSKFTNEYDQYGNVILLEEFDADGNVISRSESVYTQLEDGQWYESACTSEELDGSTTVAQYDEKNNNTSIIYYDAEGNEVGTKNWEYVYGEDDYKVSEKQYENNVLVAEIVYKLIETPDYTVNFQEIVTEYDADGGKTVTVYDENDEVLSETKYDADGNVIA